MAWADFNGDGLLDVYITRGGLKGNMGRFPKMFSDELMCNRGNSFENCITSSGIRKNNNRGRAAEWIDHNADGLLDVFIGNEITPNQLFEQRSDGSFSDVASELGLDVADSGPFVWLDVDNDGDMDLLITKSSNISLYVKSIRALLRNEVSGREDGEANLLFPITIWMVISTCLGHLPKPTFY